jgi:hypothetical protein
VEVGFFVKGEIGFEEGVELDEVFMFEVVSEVGCELVEIGLYGIDGL